MHHSGIPTKCQFPKHQHLNFHIGWMTQLHALHFSWLLQTPHNKTSNPQVCLLPGTWPRETWMMDGYNSKGHQVRVRRVGMPQRNFSNKQFQHVNCQVLKLLGVSRVPCKWAGICTHSVSPAMEKRTKTHGIVTFSCITVCENVFFKLETCILNTLFDGYSSRNFILASEILFTGWVISSELVMHFQ